MSSQIKAALSLLLLILFLLILFPAPVTLGEDQGFLRAYKDGLEAIEEGQWSLAEQKMRAAISIRPEEKAKLLLRARFKPYLPHYYLGVALDGLGDCGGALLSWAESERQGVVQKRKVYPDLQRARQRCEARARFANQLAAVESRYTAMEQELSRGERLARDPALSTVWSQGTPSLAERQARVQALLHQARSHLDAAKANSDPELIAEAEGLLGEAGREWKALERQVEVQRASTPARPSRDAGQGSEAHPDQVLGPPEVLHRAAEAYLAGSYAEVLQLLEGYEPETGTDTQLPRAETHSQLLRAAAHFSIYRIRGDEEHLAQARTAALAARVSQPGLTLSERLFSPSFRELLLSAGGAAEED